jgi:cephalosporin-C deacetylase
VRHIFLMTLVMGALNASAAFADPSLTFVASHPDSVYLPKEKISWVVTLVKDKAYPVRTASYTVKRDGQVVIGRGTLDFSNSTAATIEASCDVPATVLLEVALPGSGKSRFMAGAVAEPRKIGPAVAAPEGFDAFWAGKVKDVAAVPANAVLEKVEGHEIPAGVEYDKVTLDNVGGTHVRGQLSRPVKAGGGGKFPALLMVQYAGVYPLPRTNVTRLAEQGWLVLDISAHDLPIDEDAAFYQDQKALANYVAIGNDDREKSYFLRMFQGDMQAANYLASRADWDGKTLVVMGTSQGGLQTFVTAALCPQVTEAMALVPAGCDTEAPLHDRSMSWPYWLKASNVAGGDAAKVGEVSRYFDGANFAARLHCPTLVGVGLIDETARPTGVFSAFNGIQTEEKELVIMPASNHHGDGNTQAVYNTRATAWREALLKGKALPILK